MHKGWIWVQTYPLILCFTTYTAHFCGCKVVRLQNSSYLCSSYNRKTIIMVYRNFSLTGNIIPCQVLRIVHLCNYATAQPHTYTTARLGGCAVTHAHVSGIVHLCSCVVAYPHNRAVGQSCSYVNDIQHTGKIHSCAVAQPQKMHIFYNERLHNYTTAQPQRYKVAEKCNRVVARLCSQVITQSHNCIVKQSHNHTFTAYIIINI